MFLKFMFIVFVIRCLRVWMKLYFAMWNKKFIFAFRKYNFQNKIL